MVYKLDNIDKRILFELDRNSRIPETKLAKLLRKSKESVRYRIKKLKDEKIIRGFTTWIDLTKLGFQCVKIYLKLSNIPSKKKEFIEFVKKDGRLFWLGIAEGAWNAGLTFFVRDNREFFELKNEIFSRFNDLIIDSHTANLVGVYVRDKTFLYNSQSSWTNLFEKIEHNQLDEISIKILKELYENSRTNIVSIAEKYKTSVDIVRNGMKKLEENKIIARYTISLDYKKIGYEFYKSFLYLNNVNEKEFEKLMNYCKNNPNVVFFVKQISPWDVELEIMCESYSRYNEIIGGITEKFSHIITNVETAIMSEDYIFPSKKLIFE